MSRRKPKRLKSTVRSESRQAQALAPFAWITVIWGALTLVVSGSLNGLTGLGWGAVFWSACALDLYALAKTIGSALLLVSVEPGSPRRGALGIQTTFYGVGKLICLGLIGVALWHAKRAPSGALMMGMATLVVVPLLGGFFWSRKELQSG